jgi:sugar phosphate isomerase/epimerase
MSNNYPKLHNAMWPGLVGKASQGGDEPDISLHRMLELTAAAEVDGVKFEGVDYFLFTPHTDPDASDDDLKQIADLVASFDLKIGSLVAPIWPGTVGGPAMGSDEERDNFVLAVEKACRIARVFNDVGIRQYGAIRIDSASGVVDWAADPEANTTKIAETFRRAGQIAADNGERLVAEGEICWGGMHSWKDMVDLLEQTDMPQTVGFQADQAHTYLYLLGYNAPEHALLQEGYSEEEFDAAYTTMTSALRPWTYDFHVAQNDGTVHGAGSHDKTGRHCQADDPNGKLDITATAGYWLDGATERGIEHICWDGCMFPNAVIEDPATANAILSAMIDVRNVHGWVA